MDENLLQPGSQKVGSNMRGFTLWISTLKITLKKFRNYEYFTIFQHFSWILKVDEKPMIIRITKISEKSRGRIIPN